MRAVAKVSLDVYEKLYRQRPIEQVKRHQAGDGTKFAAILNELTTKK